MRYYKRKNQQNRSEQQASPPKDSFVREKQFGSAKRTLLSSICDQNAQISRESSLNQSMLTKNEIQNLNSTHDPKFTNNESLVDQYFPKYISSLTYGTVYIYSNQNLNKGYSYSCYTSVIVLSVTIPNQPR